MKKPDYLEVEFPQVKGTISAAAKKYFKRQEGKVLKIKFSKVRFRKEFEYKIIEAQQQEWFDWNTSKSTKYLCLKLEMVKEQD